MHNNQYEIILTKLESILSPKAPHNPVICSNSVWNHTLPTLHAPKVQSILASQRKRAADKTSMMRKTVMKPYRNDIGSIKPPVQVTLLFHSPAATEAAATYAKPH